MAEGKDEAERSTSGGRVQASKHGATGRANTGNKRKRMRVRMRSLSRRRKRMG